MKAVARKSLTLTRSQMLDGGCGQETSADYDQALMRMLYERGAPIVGSNKLRPDMQKYRWKTEVKRGGEIYRYHWERRV